MGINVLKFSHRLTLTKPYFLHGFGDGSIIHRELLFSAFLYLSLEIKLILNSSHYSFIV